MQKLGIVVEGSQQEEDALTSCLQQESLCQTQCRELYQSCYCEKQYALEREKLKDKKPGLKDCYFVPASPACTFI